MKILILLIALLLATSCSHTGFVSREPSATVGTINEISEDLLKSVEPIGDKKIFKFSVLKDSAGKFTRLYVQDPRYQFHHEFLSTLPEFKGMSQKDIEAVTYKNSKDRKAYIGVLSIDYQWFVDMDRPSGTGFYIMAEELPPVEQLRDISVLITKFYEPDFFLRDKQAFIALHHQEIEAQAKKDLFESFNLDLLFDYRSKRLAYSDGWGVGVLVAFKNQTELDAAINSNTLAKNAIIIAGEAFRDLPPCAGVISAVPLTPGSHLSLLAQMYGMPIVYEEDALQKYSPYLGKKIFLGSSLENSQTFQFFDKITTQEEEILNLAKKRSPLKFDHIPLEDKIVEVSKIPLNRVGAYGGKATKLGLLKRSIASSTVAVAAGVPVYYYHQFVDKAQYEGAPLKQFIDSQMLLLNENSTHADVTVVAEKIQKAFKKSTIKSDFVMKIKIQLMQALNIKIEAKENSEVRLKLRSSSNVEDGAEFNGAGLYESEGVCLLNCLKDDFEKGLKKVWGSLYTARGLWARRQFFVDEKRVGMGIAVHSPFKGELFNGVARYVVKRVFDGYSTSTVVITETTAQKGEELTVTGASESGTSEVSEYRDGQLTITNPYKGYPMDRTLLRSEHYKMLFDLMSQIAKNWPEKKDNLEIESEWKVMKVGNHERVVIKQVREVPKQAGLAFADGSKRIWITGDVIEFKGTSDELYNAVEALYRIRDFKLRLKHFTENDLKKSKLTVLSAQAVIKDKTVNLTPGKIVATQVDNTWTAIIPFQGDLVENFKVLITVPLLSQAVTSPVSSIGFGYGMELPSVNNANYEGELVPSSIYLDRFSEVDSRVLDITLSPSEKTCPIKIVGQKTLELHYTDRRRMYFKDLKITGILKKPILVSKVADSFHQHYIHDGKELMAIDLFADPSLSNADKKLISSYGRYLNVGLSAVEIGKKSEYEMIFSETAYNADYAFTKENFKLGKNPSGCTVLYDMGESE